MVYDGDWVAMEKTPTTTFLGDSHCRRKYDSKANVENVRSYDPHRLNQIDIPLVANENSHDKNGHLCNSNNKGDERNNISQLCEHFPRKIDALLSVVGYLHSRHAEEDRKSHFHPSIQSTVNH